MDERDVKAGDEAFGGQRLVVDGDGADDGIAREGKRPRLRRPYFPLLNGRHLVFEQQAQ